MTILYQCETHYDQQPPIDINPLLLHLYKKNKMLVICTREGMKTRIQEMRVKNDYVGPELVVCGIWELDKCGLFEEGVLIRSILESFDAVVLIGKNRAHPAYQPLIHFIENTIC